MLQTAIIGITGYGREHLRLLLYGHTMGWLQPAAAVVINPDEAVEGVKQLRELGCRIYDSVDRMWAEESGRIDLCMIPSAIGTHYPFGRAAIENGSHVFLEKPVCGTIQEVNDLARRAETAEKEVCIGFQNLYNPQVREIKQRILAGDFGRILRASGWGSWPRPRSYYARNGWAGRLQHQEAWVLDSPVNNAMAHFLMLMLYWTGPKMDQPLQPDFLECDLYRLQDIESFDTTSLRLTCADGPTVHYAVTHSGDQTIQPSLLLEGEDGTIRWSHCGSFEITTPKGSESYRCASLDRTRERMIEATVRRITTGEGPVVGIRHAAVHTRLVNGMHLSAPIENLDAKRKQERRERGDEFLVVPGLVDDLQASFETGKLLCELAPERYPSAPGRLSLKDVERFEAPAHPSLMSHS